MNHKTILILGGGPVQMQLVNAAVNEQYRIVLCDYNDNCIGRQYADVFYRASIIDKEEILTVATKEHINGIVGNTEYAMCVVAYVSSKLGLIGNSEQSIGVLTNKNKFRNLQHKIGLYSPKSEIFDSFDSFIEHKGDFIYPVIIKPTASSGTRGTTKVTSPDDVEILSKAFNECEGFSRDKSVTIEEYVSMGSTTIIAGDVFVHDGKIIWDGLLTEYRSPLAPMIPMSSILPVIASEKEYKQITADLIKAFEGAEIRHGEYNVELYFTPSRQLFIIEINARQGGNEIPEYIKIHCNTDMGRLLVTTAVGDDYYFNEVINNKKPCVYTIGHVIFSRNNGVYNGIFVDDIIKPYIHHINEYYKKGDSIESCINAASSIGMSFLTFPNRDTQIKYMTCIEDYIYPILK